MATVHRTGLANILLAIRDRLMQRLQMPPELVLVTARDSLPFDRHGDQYVWIRPRNQAPNLPVIEGGGRFDARMRRTIAVTCRTRLALDESDQDYEWLLNRELGHFELEEAIWDALYLWAPADVDENWLVAMPLQPRGTAAPQKDKVNAEWGESSLEVEVEYLMNLTLDDL